MTWRHFCSNGCPTLQNAIMSFPLWLLSSSHSSFALLSSPHWCPWFSLRYLSMRWWGAGKAPPPQHLHTQSHIWWKHNGYIEDLMGFQSSEKSLDDSGWGGCSASTDWHPTVDSAHNMGGNKAQCHGNHIKSTLKLIYLQSNDIFFPLGVCFYNFMSVSVTS